MNLGIQTEAAPVSTTGQSCGESGAPILFIMGMARSGTTFLADLLHEHFDYGMGPEGSFVPEFARRLRRYGALTNATNLSRLVNDISRCEMLEIARSAYAEDERFDITPQMILDRTSSPDFASVVRAVIQAVADRQERPNLGSKLPLYWKFAPQLEQLFGENARYIWIVRDGRDAALSLFRVPWGENSAYACARVWAQTMEALRRFETMVPPERLLVVRYEDLLGAPRRSLERLNEIVASPLSQEKLDAVTREISSSRLAGNFEKWRHEMNPEDQQIFEAIAGRWLADAGYETQFSAPTVKAVEHWRYTTQEYLRRLRLTMKAVRQQIC